MKKTTALLTLLALSLTLAGAQTNTAAVTQLTPEQIQKLGQSLNDLLPLVPPTWQPMVLHALALIGVLGVLGRVLSGFLRGGVLGVISGLFTGHNGPLNPPEQNGGFPVKGATALRNWLLAGLLSFSFALSASAQTDAPASSADKPASFWNGIGIAGQAFLNQFKADTNALAQRAWTAVPFASYDLDAKSYGGGLAIVHPISENVYVGVRLETIAGTWTAPSINLQLQKTISVFGLCDVTPFSIGGTAVFNGNVAAYVGAGANVSLWQTTIQGKPFVLGLAGDYEQWAGLSANANRKQIRAGLSGSISF